MLYSLPWIHDICAIYAKRVMNGANMKNPTKKQANYGFLYDKLEHYADLGNPVLKVQGVTERETTTWPPYVKPKSNKHPVNGDLEKGTPSDYSKHISGQTDHLDEKNVHRPVSAMKEKCKASCSWRCLWWGA